jgi:hypothetical protein
MYHSWLRDDIAGNNMGCAAQEEDKEGQGSLLGGQASKTIGRHMIAFWHGWRLWAFRIGICSNLLGCQMRL